MRPYKEEKHNISRLSVVAIVLLSIVTLILACKVLDELSDARKSRDYWDELQGSVTVMAERKGEALPEPTPGVKAVPREEAIAEVPPEEEAEPVTPEIVIPDAVDFDRLHAVSEDAVAWLFAPGTLINYPVAQAEDNDYYLHRLLDGTEAGGGTLFADYRCSADFSDYNTVIYGHHMKNGSMFASLLGYRDSAYYAAHPVMYLYLPGTRCTLELIAGYTTDAYDIAYSVPATKEMRDEIISQALGKSSFISGVTAGGEDRIVTLSTCSYDYDDARYVVIGRIVENQQTDNPGGFPLL